MSRRKWICLDCNVDTGKIYEHYMLVDSVWLAIHNSIFGMLCIGCVEKRLGRQLTAADFNNSYVNSTKFGCKSARLLDRLKR